MALFAIANAVCAIVPALRGLVAIGLRQKQQVHSKQQLSEAWCLPRCAEL